LSTIKAHRAVAHVAAGTGGDGTLRPLVAINVPQRSTVEVLRAHPMGKLLACAIPLEIAVAVLIAPPAIAHRLLQPIACRRATIGRAVPMADVVPPTDVAVARVNPVMDVDGVPAMDVDVEVPPVPVHAPPQ
jgi:hypothetical protein